MSSDNQYTALGPAIIGFQTDGANIDQGASIGGNEVGVVGMCVGRGVNGDGVRGFAAGNFSGVAGFGGGVSGTEAGTGVWGEGGPRAPGVRGIGGGGPEAGTGVFGFGGDGGGPGVRGIGAGAVNTLTDSVNNAGVGVYGISTEFIGVQGESDSGPGVFGHSEDGVGVEGECSGGAGVSGGSVTGPGGAFSSIAGAQLRIPPSATTLADTAQSAVFKLVENGRPGDLYFYSENEGSGSLETSSLWICLGTPAGASTPVWAEIALGPITMTV
jgi:hypothetical protein